MTARYLILLILSARLMAFEPALPGYRFEFPRDHFAHPEFQTEWWYYTGNLRSADGRRFGFELTFFRQAIQREEPPQGPWDLHQVYLAHLTLSDIDAGQFLKFERLNRAGPGLAGTDAERMRIWNGNWSVDWRSPAGEQTLRAVSAAFDLDLRLDPAKPPVIHGVNGVSLKAAGEGKASHYVSLTRLQAKGSLKLDGAELAVEGTAWMDHEFSTNSLGEGQVGWDWMSIQLDDGSDLMLYRTRRDDGSTDPFSSGTYVDPGGRSRHLKREDFEMIPGETWKSETTGAEYPLRWRIVIPSLEMELRCQTNLDQQEVVSETGVAGNYWEGAVWYDGTTQNRPVKGVGYLEMTGYDKPLKL